jgi:hypothetical protein
MTLPRNKLITAAAALVLMTGSLGCGALRAAKNVGDNLSTLGDLADKIQKAEKITYQAEYKLTDGSKVTVAQQPPSAAAVGDKGRFIANTDAFYFCDTEQSPVTCTKTPNTDGDTNSAAAASLWSGVGTGFVAAPLALALLTGALVIPTVKVKKSEQKIAGQQSTCAEVTNIAAGTGNSSDGNMDNLDAFSVCITDKGVLSKFSGTGTSGETNGVELTSYKDKVDASLLQVPDGAKIVDSTNPDPSATE